MTRRAVLPGVGELEEMLRKPGATRASLAKEFGVSRSAVSLRLTRAGREPGLNRHKELLPWRVATPHQMDYTARMLRLEARVRAGEKIAPGDRKKLDSWKLSLVEDGDVVVLYLREHSCSHCGGDGGFHLMRRAEARAMYGEPDDRFDTELIFVTQSQGESMLPDD
jgi:hypothetical protein